MAGILLNKPEGSSWTNEQWEAIAFRGDNVLVAAAAGSGKTAVLVERIIRRIMDDHEPADVDRLLIATFTKAAADEMRHRIREALEKALFADPDNNHLRRQLAFVHRASITTLHSFCLEVIQRHYSTIGLDPAFRIANETEVDLLRQDICTALFEEFYGTSVPGDGFWTLVDWFGGERGDEGLQKLVQQLYDFAMSHPWPEYWLREMAARFVLSSSNAEEKLGYWTDIIAADVLLELEGAEELLHEALLLAGSPGGPMVYMSTLQEDKRQVADLKDAARLSWQGLYTCFQTVSFGKLKPARGGDLDKNIQEQCKILRDAVKKIIVGLQEELFQREPSQYAEELSVMEPVITSLVHVVMVFTHQYRQQKVDKGLVDFTDLEHYCLQILRSTDASPHKEIPSPAALAYREQFVEVMLDEYQDTNMVQEAILVLVARESPGNRFMVGDVKQSIYRFRLAEPGLFLNKYKQYSTEGSGKRIDLSRNFRSRSEIVDGANYIFRQIMQERSAEINYDVRAELVCGASYPLSGEDLSVEVLLIDREDDHRNNDEAESEETDVPDEANQAEEEVEQIDTAQLEARLIGSRIKQMLGADGTPPMQVMDKRLNAVRTITYRDIVILLRATKAWAPVLIEELQLAGIPAYTELSTGYFSAVEVETMLSILQVIDNPYQDIPLAAVLRSPIVGLTADQLAAVRLASKGSFYDAVLNFAASNQPLEAVAAADIHDHDISAPWRQRVVHFQILLKGWRLEAREGALSNLIMQIYRHTGYLDFVGSMPAGFQRQANLRALYDRARQYESTSFRGLFRFLRFIERMKDNGGDLGTARSLGEQEDVVRIMSIHKSKGLEFPIVFVAGLGKPFNRQDLNGSFLLHKQLGYGPKLIDPKLRVSYPTLPLLAIRRRVRMELLAEEMRVLYVALTRPKEKLFLVGSLRALAANLQRWGRHAFHPSVELPPHAIVKARHYMDWIGSAVIRHPDAAGWRAMAGLPPGFSEVLSGERSRWRLQIISPELLIQEAASTAEHSYTDSTRAEQIRRLMPITFADPAVESVLLSEKVGHQITPLREEVNRRLNWVYPYDDAKGILSKTTVTEMKRLSESRLFNSTWNDSILGNANGSNANSPSITSRPRFMEARKLTSAERGTVYHALMQQLPLQQSIDLGMITSTLYQMLERQLLNEEQVQSVDPMVIVNFFESPLGKRLQAADQVKRELPFSYGLPSREVYPHLITTEETILIQGVIDCLFSDEKGMVLIDYKTDRITEGSLSEAAERYRVQIELYTKAICDIYQKSSLEAYLYFFDGSHFVQLK